MENWFDIIILVVLLVVYAVGCKVYCHSYFAPFKYMASRIKKLLLALKSLLKG